MEMNSKTEREQQSPTGWETKLGEAIFFALAAAFSIYLAHDAFVRPDSSFVAKLPREGNVPPWLIRTITAFLAFVFTFGFISKLFSLFQKEPPDLSHIDLD